jgi:hypothetical protein
MGSASSTASDAVTTDKAGRKTGAFHCFLMPRWFLVPARIALTVLNSQVPVQVHANSAIRMEAEIF